MNILLAVTGSISAYKTYDLAREFTKANHQVKVILTKGGEQFIKASTFLYLGVQEVYSSQDDFNTSKNLGKILHIELKEWMDLLLIAPASTNSIGKLAHGLCDDLLGSVLKINQLSFFRP
jgi:phosphopantothenoylcysteine decarboxylase/phosphopantothenate--cysteine ligase